VRLLVSVRSPTEAARAVEGGADIVDAKEPARGSLGAVEGEVLRTIAGALPAAVPLSVALGDLAEPAEVDAATTALGLSRLRTDYLKVGFAGVADATRVGNTIARLVATAADLPGRPRVVAVAYADHLESGSPEPSAVSALGEAAGAHGLLLDTWTKDGRDLFAWMSPPLLKEWVARVRTGGMVAAVAGSIREDIIATVLAAQPDIVGVRGAACEGGRLGSVATSRVRTLKTAVIDFVSTSDAAHAKRHTQAALSFAPTP
jgi:(5-formylfuran-3-yl)methyl phosphate synthase